MKKVLILNNSLKPCGVQQWGGRIYNILKESKKYFFEYKEVTSQDETVSAIIESNPSIILYNYHVMTMNFLTSEVIHKFSNIKHIAILHEGYSPEKDTIGFDYFIYCVKFLAVNPEVSNKVFLLPIRNLLKYAGSYPVNEIPTIGSFGFGFPSKRFDYIVETVNKEFDVANIRFHMAKSIYADPNGDVARETIKKCQEKITKPGITLYTDQDFLSDDEILEFLAGNDINCFFYDNSKTDAVAGSLDLALSVKRPIAVTKVPMFSHLYSLVPSICIEDSTIKEIMNRGVKELEPIYTAFSNDNFILFFEAVLDRAER